MSKRHIITLLWLAAATILTPAMAQNYDGCYTNLPIELQKVKAPSIPDRRVSITDYGAKGDGQTLCTAAIDEAIAALTRQGGGHVDIPRGVWLTGPIVLDNNIDLHLEEGAILLFSSDKNLFLQPVKGKGITRWRAGNIGKEKARLQHHRQRHYRRKREILATGEKRESE